MHRVVGTGVDDLPLPARADRIDLHDAVTALGDGVVFRGANAGRVVAMLAPVEQIGDVDRGEAPALPLPDIDPFVAVPRHRGAVAGEIVAHVFVLDGEHAVPASGAERHV